MITDEDILEKSEMYILDRMQEFVSNEEVITFPAAKHVLALIQRAVSFTYPIPSLPFRTEYHRIRNVMESLRSRQ